MIVRIFQVVTRPGKEDAFGRFFHDTAIPLMKRTKGLVHVIPGAPLADTPREFCFVMVWEDIDALKAFVGDDISSPHIDPMEAELVESRSIKHYHFVESEILL
ncbi:Antibiotic biosynthesis monooxygenase [Aliiroseovarius sediminilitoris]|uniref:Antibiotic biosynthesis monooxygenase n=2 Tax=Aliiroseovarius sediminilitoris TaxID=1173584 RepID=A0A1I0PMY8_9RHOB|nr:Antibiotic biosynthesis monooxygenase [Aliiroseovarius sediminilitoris]